MVNHILHANSNYYTHSLDIWTCTAKIVQQTTSLLNDFSSACPNIKLVYNNHCYNDPQVVHTVHTSIHKLGLHEQSINHIQKSINHMLRYSSHPLKMHFSQYQASPLFTSVAVLGHYFWGGGGGGGGGRGLR